MKVLYLDCGMGAAGDMLAAALLELFPDPEAFLEELNALGIPGIRFCMEESVKCGLKGTSVSVMINDTEEEIPDLYEHDVCECDHHEHRHMHGHRHQHNGESENVTEYSHNDLHTSEHILKDHTAIPENVKNDVMKVYELIAEAESHAHGVPVTEIHFHEVGTMDAVADITAVCLLMDRLSPDKVIASPVHVGSGQVRCAHGILPVPTPATAYILQEIPTYGGGIKGELCTPTGAALLKYFVDEFGTMPEMKVERIGYGMGKKDFKAANCVRAMLGETERVDFTMEQKYWEECVKFHGHECGGLTIGYKAALFAMELLDIQFSEDEQIVCVTENDACGVDAIQVMLGCSAGKGNLLFRLRGKQAFSFYNRETGKAVRLVLRERPQMSREESFRYMKEKEPKDLFEVKEVKNQLPEKARLFGSYKCEICGEMTMESMLRLENGKKVCLDCFHPYNRFG